MKLEGGCAGHAPGGLDDEVAELGSGRTAAVLASVLVAGALALLPAAVALGLIPLSLDQLAWAMGAAGLAAGAAKVIAVLAAVVDRWRHQVRLANVLAD